MKTTLQPLVLSETKSLDDQIACSATLLAEYVSECAIEPRTQPSPNLSVRKVPQSLPKRRRSSISLSALLILLSGLFGAGLCLYQSQTSWKPAVRPIQDYRVGQAVRSENPTGEEDLSLGDHVDPATWRHLILKAPKTDGSFADVELLRPLWWLEEREAKVGIFIDIDVPHCGIEGEAEVLAIKSCPPVEPTPKGYRTVTGTFRHHAAEVIDLYIDGLDQPIGTTPNHPFWSEERQEFVRADALQNGEVLRDSMGRIVRAQSHSSRKETATVFNLEVQCQHAYCISSTGLLVHNSGVVCPQKKKVYRELSGEDRKRMQQGLGLLPKGSGGTPADQIKGNPTRFISAAEERAATARFRSGNGLVEIDVDAAVSAGGGFVDHNNVVQSARRDALPRDVKNAERALEVMFKDFIPFNALKLLSDDD